MWYSLWYKVATTCGTAIKRETNECMQKQEALNAKNI